MSVEIERRSSRPGTETRVQPRAYPPGMAMERSRRVADVWNWLPAFRVVAEYESIHKASAVLHLSASSLSRTIKLLEDAVEEPLFVRTATGLTLTPFGATLLEGARDALRRVDDAMASGVSSQRAPRTIVAGASGGALAELLARAVGTLAGETSFRLLDVDGAAVAGDLLRGSLDVALVSRCDPDLPAALTSERLGQLVLAVHSREGARDDVVVALDGLCEVGSARVIATVASIGAAVRVAEASRASVVLPVKLAPPGFFVVTPLTEVVAVHAVRRRPVGAACPGRDVMEATRAMLLDAPPPS